MAHTGLSARRGLSGGVEALARCFCIVTATLSWPETKIAPILWVPIIDPCYKARG
jgi:hypothetical protein